MTKNGKLYQSGLKIQGFIEGKNQKNSSQISIKKALENVIKQKGAYILCSTQSVSGVYLEAREEALREEIEKRGISVQSN